MKQTHSFTLRILLIGIGVALTTSMRAIPASRITKTATLIDGSVVTLQLVGDEFCHFYVDSINQKYIRRQDGTYEKILSAESNRRMLRAVQKREDMRSPRMRQSTDLPPRGLVILVNFQDQQFHASNSAAEMDSLLNGKTYTYDLSIGSVRQYFYDQSAGQYNPFFDVVGPVTLPNNAAYYGSNNEDEDDVLPGDFVLHACSIAAEIPGIDFSNYDSDQDGWLDFVYLIYAGYGEADGGGENTLWPCSWDIPSSIYFGNCSLTDYMDTTQYTFGGKTIGKFAYSSELNYRTTIRNVRGFSLTNPKRNGIGTLCHEYSHVIGLLDYYDTEYGYNHENYLTPESFSLMGSGSYNIDGDVPPNYSVYDRFCLGWSSPTLLTDSQEVIIPQDNYSGYCITLNDVMPTPYDTAAVYYMENRQQNGWDIGLPHHGMLLWKIRFDLQLWIENKINCPENDPHIMIVSAGGDYYYDSRIPFPGTRNVTSYMDIPDHYISSITEQDSTIRFIFSSYFISETEEPGTTESELYDCSTDSTEKIIHNGQLYIRKNGNIYSIFGTKL